MSTRDRLLGLVLLGMLLGDHLGAEEPEVEEPYHHYPDCEGCPAYDLCSGAGVFDEEVNSEDSVGVRAEAA